MSDLLNNGEVDVGIERDRLFTTYVQYIRGLSDQRHNQFSHFLTVHLFLLPAHAALLTNRNFEGMVYSVLVAILGVLICVTSYRMIVAKFERIDVAYQELIQIESRMPYRFFTVLAEIMGDGTKKKGRQYKSKIRKAELGLHWIIGLLYACMPIVHYNMEWLQWKLGK
jgi:hypothetical protein